MLHLKVVYVLPTIYLSPLFSFPHNVLANQPFIQQEKKQPRRRNDRRAPFIDCFFSERDFFGYRAGGIGFFIGTASFLISGAGHYSFIAFPENFGMSCMRKVAQNFLERMCFLFEKETF